VNIYFSCAITGGRTDQSIYADIVSFLLAAGHQVPTAHLSAADVMAEEAIVAPRVVYERDVAWVAGCDACIAEVSTPSHGVGYEIALALSLDKPVLCCYQQGVPVSKMITGNTQASLSLYAYHNEKDLLEKVQSFLESLPAGAEGHDWNVTSGQ
jgi:nucleoside 2-deoxyribosyltransferase